jgi:excisionase family DNA binding protein
MDEQKQQEFIDLEAVSKYLGVSISTVYRYIHSKENPLPSIKISKGVLRVNKQELEGWVLKFRVKNLEEKN